MTEIQRTFVFVGVAAASLAVALLAAPSAPKAPKEFEQVGKEFFPDFSNPDAAKQLQVVAYDADTAASTIFSVEFKDGKWRIPARHNYPVDAKDRLAKCAASIIGLKREAVAGHRDAEFPDFDVVDPLDENSQSLKRGHRITLKDEAGNVVADYIIGKAVPNRSGQFYLRRPDEKITYTAKISLDLSTKFADWIEPDLLKVTAFDLRKIVVDKHSVDIEKRRIVGAERSTLSRKTSSDPWKMDELDEATEEVNQDEVRKIVDALDNLKIIGVRPKPVKLSRDLTVAEGITIDRSTLMDLGDKGYYLVPTQGGGQELVSKEGSLNATTEQGVEYLLRFGDVFSGTEEEIEFGFTKQNEDSGDKQADEKPSQTLKKSRYLFVTVQLDDDAISPKLEDPTQPEPIGEAPPEAAAAAPNPDDPADATQPGNVGPAAEYAAKKRDYDAALAKYDGDKLKYESDKKLREDKIKEGEKKVKELNARFADWYYVISAESFENLRQGRVTLVKAKSATPAAATPANPAGVSQPGF